MEDLPGRIAFEATNDFATGLALLDPALVVALGARFDPQAGEHDAVERGIGLTITAAVEATELRSTGLTPHKAAKDASLSRRSGLSPTVISRATAVSGPIPTTSSSCGA
ncbi:hypothetical protein ACH4PR_51420 [Streptomyces mirabilis]|uniref:hypothetical protein n=1 Tax=Streptomyces mirabilis TaxID=68239 RepID=UPI0037A77BBC